MKHAQNRKTKNPNNRTRLAVEISRLIWIVLHLQFSRKEVEASQG